MLGIKFMGDVPFHDVYIHALVRDAEGQKMSKSKGNVVDPLAIMEQFGTDAFRFTLAALAGQGRDIRLSEERIEGYRNFANKLWNASRLVLSNLDGYDPRLARRGRPPWPTGGSGAAPPPRCGRFAAPWTPTGSTTRRRRIYQFLWHELCDWYLEIAKQSLYQKDDAVARAVTQQTLVETLDITLRLLHPFMPFISEDIWQRLPREGGGDSIMIAPFPRASRKGHDAGAEAWMGGVIGIVSAIRTIRSESRISPAVELAAVVRPRSVRDAAILAEAAPLMGALARATITVDPAAVRPPQSALAMAHGAEVYVRLEGVVDLAAERQRLAKEVERAAKEIAFLEGKLGRPDFVERAPAEIVARERERLAEQQAAREKLTASLVALT